MKGKRNSYTIHPLIIIFFWVIFSASGVSAELKMDAVYPTLGVMGQGLNVTLKGTGFDGNTRVSICLDSGNKRAIIGNRDIPSTASDVEVVGDTAYVVNYWGYSLQVIDVSTSSDPQIVGSVDTPGRAFRVTVVGNLAYVADETSSLQVIDVSNPASPQIIDSVEGLVTAQDVTVVGDIAYVADRGYGLRLIDVNPSSPTYHEIIDGAPTPTTYLRSVAVDGDIAYLAAYGHGFYAVDINPSSPTYLTTLDGIDTPGFALDVTVVGDTAYVADQYEGLQVVDVSDPENLVIIGDVNTPGSAEQVMVVGNLAYVADNTTGLYVIDISTSTNPQIIGFWDTPGQAWGVTVVDDLAYVAGGGLYVIDVSILTPPQKIGSVDTIQATDATVVGDIAYVSDSGLMFDWTGLQVVDVSTPSNPEIIDSVDLPDGDVTREVVVSGNYAYVADDDDGGLQIVNISTPSNPQLIGSGVNTPGSAHGVTVVGNLAYVADWSSGLQVIDVSTPSQPQIIGSAATQGYAEKVTIVGNLAYVAAGALQVIDVSTPSQPQVIGTSYESSTFKDVEVVGDYAFLADYSWHWLRVIDINPSSPTYLVRVGWVDAPGTPWGVTIVGNHAYMAAGFAGLHMIDISTPTNPLIIGSVDTPGYAYDVTIVGDLAYMADYYGGLVIVPIPVEIVPNTVSPDGTEISLTLPSPIMRGRYTLRVFNNTESDELPGAVSFTDDENILNSKAIIVAGGGPTAEGGTLWEETKQCANKAYDTLILQGYQHDSIYYMSMETGNSYVDPFNPNDMKSDLSNAITVWADNATQLLLFFADHGLEEKFVLYKDNGSSQMLSAQELDGWLDTLQQNSTTLTGPVTFAYDACEAGSFVSKMRPPAGKDRVVITSASYEPAYFLDNGKGSFSFQFWDKTLLNKGNLGEAFSYANEVMQTYQSAQVEANWDFEGITNESGDIAIVDNMTIQRGVYAYTGIHPLVTSVSDHQTISSETEATIWASGVIDAQSVWALIIPPDVNPDDPSTPIETLPSIQLTDLDGDHIYQGTYPGFDLGGTYVIVIKAQATKEIYSYVQDSMIFQTIYSPPMYTSVTKTSGDPGIDPDGYEEDDTFNQASPIVANDYAPQSHNFHDVGDVDWVKFYGLLSEIYKVKAYSLGVTCDVIIELYDSDGTTLLAGPINNAGAGEDEFLEWTCPQEDVYYVKISSANSNYGENVRYDLKVYRPIGGEPGNLIGRLTDSQDNGIGDAHVKTTLGATWSYSNGYYLLVLPSGTHSITVTANGYFPDTADVTIQAGNDTTENFELESSNQAPTDISLTNTSVEENQPVGTTVGTFATTDPNPGDTHTYSLVSGTGDTGNGSFTISGSTLLTSAVFDYETKSSYSIRVQTDDNNGGTFEKEFIISVTDANDAPTDIDLSSSSVAENQSIETTVGTFSTTDQDSGDSHTYTLVSGTGDSGNWSFSISGSTLLTDAVFDYEAQSSYSIRVMTDDNNGGTAVKVFAISVTDANDAPTFTSTPVISAVEDQLYTYNITAADDDQGDTLTITAPTLPLWLNLTGHGTGSVTLTGTPTNAEVGPHSVGLVVTDLATATDTQSFTVQVSNANDPPIVANPIPDQETTADTAFSFQFSASTFSDPDIGDTLTYTATLSDSTPLPTWLDFNSSTRTFSGTPNTSGVGTLTIRVTATDNGTPPANVFDDFNLGVIMNVSLKEGFNLIAIPEDVTGQPDLVDWLPVFGDITEIEKVMAYDDQAGKYITLIPEDPSNPSFILQGGEGLIVYAKQDKVVSFASLLCSSLDLNQGFNLIGIACPPDNYTAFQLLNALGSTNVASVQRYSTDKGMFETAGFDPGSNPSGVDFSVIAGEGYFIYMKQEVLDFTF